MIVALLFYGPRVRRGRSRRRARVGVGASARRLQMVVQLPTVFRLAAASALRSRLRLRARARGRAELPSGVREPRRRADQRLRRHRAREQHRRSTAPSALLELRADDLRAADQPLRHVDLRGRAAGDVARHGGPTRRRSRACARDSTPHCRVWRSSCVPSALAFLVLGDAIAACCSQHGRFTRDRQPAHVGDPRGLGGRTRRQRARAALLVDVLRAARHADAALVRARARRAHRRARLPVRVSACRACSALPRVDRCGGTHRVRGHRRLGGVLLCCVARSRSASAARACRARRSPSSGARRSSRRCSGSGVMQLARAAHPHCVAASWPSRAFALVYGAVTCASRS